jgi:hypothetical protein
MAESPLELFIKHLMYLRNNPESVAKEFAPDLDLTTKEVNRVLDGGGKCGIFSFKTKSGKARKYWSISSLIDVDDSGDEITITFRKQTLEETLFGSESDDPESE